MRIRVLATGLWVAVCLAGGTALPAQMADGPDPTDPEIAHIAVTANAIDVEMAELALERARSAEVRAFAEMMVADHNAVNGQAAALAERLGVTPRDNGVSQSLREGADTARDRLEELDGGAFDAAYMEREVAYHGAVLSALDDLLIPSTDNAELRALLERVRPVIAAHLEHAESLAADVGGGR